MSVLLAPPRPKPESTACRSGVGRRRSVRNRARSTQN